MHIAESVQENEKHEIPKNFEVQVDHPIQAIKPDLIFIWKKKITKQSVDFAISHTYIYIYIYIY